MYDVNEVRELVAAAVGAALRADHFEWGETLIPPAASPEACVQIGAAADRYAMPMPPTPREIGTDPAAVAEVAAYLCAVVEAATPGLTLRSGVVTASPGCNLIVVVDHGAVTVTRIARDGVGSVAAIGAPERFNTAGLEDALDVEAALLQAGYSPTTPTYVVSAELAAGHRTLRTLATSLPVIRAAQPLGAALAEAFTGPRETANS